MGRLFGTDGIRGLANRDLTAEVAVDLSVAAAHVLGEAGAFARRTDRRPLALVGRDPRASGEFLQSAVIAGLASAGVDVQQLGVLPTPAVAYLTAALDADLGVMISASHNPMPDNGIKFLARGGHKLADATEDAIEARLREPWDRPTGAAVGRVHVPAGEWRRYIDHVVGTVLHGLHGISVVLDCANGAASRVAPAAFVAAGATVHTIHDHTDGYSINDGCGSTHLDDLRAAVVREGADIGFAFDGDADRCLAADAAGTVIDGDQILAVLARAMRDRGELVHDTVVGTVMSNLGFQRAMDELGITVVQTAVGDRYVLEAMQRGGFVLGGEQSGHVIMALHATTGDGLLTALHMTEQMAATGRTAADLAAVMTRLPQVLVNVAGVDKSRADSDPDVVTAVGRAQAELEGVGRVLLRPSGTEALVRVMVEAPTAERAEAVARDLAGVVEHRLAL
ncbi:MAG: phosphoglucosamine mutase [Nocardioidaceae bacterium]|nr:phosphoglucosamine mutase [Nocardioidaceae bacterium]